MKKLPFKTQPKTATATVGTEETGTLEFPVYKGLTVGEQIQVDEVGKNYPDAFSEASRLAVRIDAEMELNDLILAFDIVTNRGWETEQREELERVIKEEGLPKDEASKRSQELEERIKLFRSARIRYAPDIMQLNETSATAAQARMRTAVTTVLQDRLRLSGELPGAKCREILGIVKSSLKKNNVPSDAIASIEEEISQALNFWTQADTSGLSGELFQKIWEFVQREQNGESHEEPVKITADDVGKQPGESELVPPSSGTSSTGESNGTGPMMPGLMPTTSPVSQPG